METYNLTASIVTYQNDFSRLYKTISSFISSPLKVKLYIIDNSPTDTLKAHILKINDSKGSNGSTNSSITYIFNQGKNIGYGSAHNKAISECLKFSKYHVILNPDLYFHSEVLEKLYQLMEDDLEIGLITPKILYPNNNMQACCKLIPTPLNLFVRRFIKIKKISESLNKKYELLDFGYNKIMEIPIISGCFMFFRATTLKDIGLFDERFFMYLEDVDLCRRVHHYYHFKDNDKNKNKKYKVIFNPSTTIYHDYEKGSYKNIKLLMYHLSSSIKYFNKWGWFFDSERKKINQNALKSI
ncbi:MAG: glycosyltransferase [Oligoflexia bacterium]|nr:glycosyltransferase [Oligoflexia bacterium]